jgi:hypothetical protein
MFKSKYNSDRSESIDINDFYKYFKELTLELKIDEDVDCIDVFNDFDSHVEAFILTYFLSNKKWTKPFFPRYPDEWNSVSMKTHASS